MLLTTILRAVIAVRFALLGSPDVLLAAALDPTVVVAIVAGCLALASTAISLRSRAQSDLVDDLSADRKDLREQLSASETKVAVLKVQVRDQEDDLMESHRRERDLAARIIALGGEI